MLDIPATLKIEHENLHADLAAALKMPGQTGQAAKEVAVVGVGLGESMKISPHNRKPASPMAVRPRPFE